jgi:hypothetical protein
MSDRTDPRLVAVINAIADDAVMNRARATVVARGLQLLEPILAGEPHAERWRRQNADALREMAALGNARGVAQKVARRMAPNNPSEQYNLAQRFRGLLRKQK